MRKQESFYDHYSHKLHGVLYHNKKNHVSVVLIFILTISSLLPFGFQRIDTAAAFQSGPLIIAASSWSPAGSPPSGGFVGDRGDRLYLQIVNNNAFQIRYLLGTISLDPKIMTNASGGTVATMNNFTVFGETINSGQLVSLDFTVNIAPNATAGLAPFNVSLSYQDISSGATLTQLTPSTIPIYGLATVAVKPLTTSVQIVGTSDVSFLVSNLGLATMYTPSVLLSLPNGLIVTGNFTSPPITPDITPGSNASFSFNVVAGAKTSLGTYSGTVTVVYNDQFGNPHRSSFTVGIPVVGTISLVVQNEEIVQNLANLTVTGTIINFGTAAAILTQVNGYLNGSSSSAGITGSASSYLGTIAPRSPAFFTLIVPYSSQSSSKPSQFVLDLTYQNATRQTQVVTNSTSFVLLAASQLPQPPGIGQQLYIEIAILVVIIVVAIISILFYRRRIFRSF